MGGGGWFDEPAVPCAPLGALALWLNTFHVPAFVFASGYIHSYLRREAGRYGGVRSVLARKARRLLVPCALVSLLWAAPAYGLVFGADELVGKFVLMAAPSQLWFLPMLFWCFVAAELAWRCAPGLLRGPDARVGAALAVLAVGSPVASRLTGAPSRLLPPASTSSSSGRGGPSGPPARGGSGRSARPGSSLRTRRCSPSGAPSQGLTGSSPPWRRAWRWSR